MLLELGGLCVSVCVREPKKQKLSLEIKFWYSLNLLNANFDSEFPFLLDFNINNLK